MTWATTAVTALCQEYNADHNVVHCTQNYLWLVQSWFMSGVLGLGWLQAIT